MSGSVSPDDLFHPLIEHAIELSAQWHDGTYRKGAWREPAFEVPEGHDIQVPVMAHLAAVASIVRRAGWPPEVVAAAYLHDTIEDMNAHGQRLRRKQLRDAMGPQVAQLVARVSEQKLNADGSLRAWRDRKEDYIAGLKDGPVEAVAISLADKIHNLWSMNQSLASGDDIFAVLSAGPSEQLWYHKTVLDASHRHTDPRLTPMRTRLQTELDRFAEQVDAYAAPAS
jgi:(p)ppGpp synthase/HD superfamily hydrolase